MIAVGRMASSVREFWTDEGVHPTIPEHQTFFFSASNSARGIGNYDGGNGRAALPFSEPESESCPMQNP